MRKSTIITNLIFAVIFSALALLALSYSSGAWFAREYEGSKTISPQAFDAKISIGKKISETEVIFAFPVVFRMSTKLGLDDNFNMAAVPVVFSIENTGEVACKMRVDITIQMAAPDTAALKYAYRNLSIDQISADGAADSNGRTGLLKQVYAALNANIYTSGEKSGKIPDKDIADSNAIELKDKTIPAKETATITVIFWVDYDQIITHGYIQNGSVKDTSFSVNAVIRAVDANMP